MMTRKQLKALRRHKRIVKERNIRINNMRFTPAPFIPGRSRSYRLYAI